MSDILFQTARLTLTPLKEEHFCDFKKMDQDPEVMKYIRKPSNNDTEARERFERLLAYNKSYPGMGAFAVCEHGSAECIGVAVIIHIEMKPENEKIEIGYRFAQKVWGKGYATEVARGLVEYGTEVLKLKEIYGTTNPDHVVSQKVLLNAGLVEIGTAEYYGGSKFFRLVN